MKNTLLKMTLIVYSNIGGDLRIGLLKSGRNLNKTSNTEENPNRTLSKIFKNLYSDETYQKCLIAWKLSLTSDKKLKIHS